MKFFLCFCKHSIKYDCQFDLVVYNFAPLILTDMLTREQIEEIQGEAREKGISIKALLKEKGIPEHQYFWWKRKYARAEVPDGFLPIAGAVLWTPFRE